MEKKPVIAYIESPYGSFGDENPDRSALQFFLEEDCGCRVLAYRYEQDFKEDLELIKKLIDENSLILVIVKQEEYSEEEHLEVIKEVRNFSSDLPIVVIPEGWGEEAFKAPEEDKSLYAFDYFDCSLIQLVKQLVSNWKPPLNYFGVKTKEDQAILTSQLEKAYLAHKDEEGMLGTPDYDSQITTEALRLRLLSPDLVKKEFDDTIDKTPKEFSKTKSSLYDLETKKIKEMTEEQRKEFDNQLLRATGREPAEGGGVYVRRVSFGQDVSGFAIDPITLKTLITTGFGEHHLAGDKLSNTISAIEILRQKAKAPTSEPLFDDNLFHSSRRRIITGSIFERIEGFSTPILRLYRENASSENMKRVIKFLKKQQKFIPVDPYGQLLE